MKRTEFLLDVTDEDALDVWFDVGARRVVAFSVNYRAFIEGEWHEVARYDTTHGGLHLHEFGRDGTEKVTRLEDILNQDYTASLRNALQDLNANWKEFKKKWEANP